MRKPLNRCLAALLALLLVLTLFPAALAAEPKTPAETPEPEGAAEALVGIFENTRIDKGAVLVAKDYEEITLVDELFLEYYLGSGLVKGLDKGSNKERMKAAVTKKRDERLADPELNGALTLIPLAYLSERLGLGVQFSTDIVNTMHQFIEDN